MKITVVKVKMKTIVMQINKNNNKEWQKNLKTKVFYNKKLYN